MNSATEINIAAYSPVLELQVTDIVQYKKVIESHVVKHSIKWVIRKTTRNDITDKGLDGARGTHVQTIFGEVCMNAIVLEANDTLWPFKEPCKKKVRRSNTRFVR